MIYKKKLIFLFLIFTICILFFKYEKENFLKLNKSKEKYQLSKSVLPLVEFDSKFIKNRTDDWISKRNRNDICYGLLEKDKILMTKWMQHYKVKSPKIHFYAYHNDFSKQDLINVIDKNSNKNLIIKITHLQSNFGIIIIENNKLKKNKEDYINSIYETCLDRFNSSFVCNGDNNNAPTTDEIEKGVKQTNFKLYETIEPGIIIQDFFYSYKENVISEPYELKVLMIGDKIIRITNFSIKFYLQPYTLNKELYFNISKLCKQVSSIIKTDLLRVDVFIKGKEVYLNEISMSPYAGLNRVNYFLPKKELESYIKRIKLSDIVENKYLDDLCKSSKTRSLPIKKYMSNKNSLKEKFKFNFF